MLYDRVATAADLYKANKVAKLLMTGDNSEVDHNEVEAMRRTAVQLGVPDSESCWTTRGSAVGIAAIAPARYLA